MTFLPSLLELLRVVRLPVGRLSNYHLSLSLGGIIILLKILQRSTRYVHQYVLKTKTENLQLMTGPAEIRKYALYLPQ